MLSVVMLTGLLQQRNSNFEGVVSGKFAVVGIDSPQSSFLPVKQLDGKKYIARGTEDT